jgi:hypothetical protein
MVAMMPTCRLGLREARGLFAILSATQRNDVGMAVDVLGNNHMPVLFRKGHRVAQDARNFALGKFPVALPGSQKNA